MKFYLGVIDNSWYTYLSTIEPEDINFWQPGGNTAFKVIEQGAPFLFKLRSPYNVIGGIGFFVSHTFLPVNMAWDVFNNRNGSANFLQFKQAILNYRTDKLNQNPSIGCIVLTNPIFFKKQDWIDVSPYWSASIVQGKSFDSNTTIGDELWRKINTVLQKYIGAETPSNQENQFIVNEPPWAGYGNSVLHKVRIGQGAFRVLVT